MVAESDKRNTWREFYEITKDRPPQQLLVRALSHVQGRMSALDLGAGALRDTRELLRQGYEHVTAVDNEPMMAEVAQEIGDSRLVAITSTFNEFDFPTDEYDVVTAQWALPFNPPDTFNEMWSKVRRSIKSGGLFTGQFFGVNDEWNTPGRNMTFHTREQAEQLISDMEIIEFTEEDQDGRIANGTPKHWHVFHVIARRK